MLELELNSCTLEDPSCLMDAWRKIFFIHRYLFSGKKRKKSFIHRRMEMNHCIFIPRTNWLKYSSSFLRDINVIFFGLKIFRFPRCYEKALSCQWGIHSSDLSERGKMGEKVRKKASSSPHVWKFKTGEILLFVICWSQTISTSIC